MLQKENFFIFDDYVCLIKAVTSHGYIQEVEIFIKFLYSRYWITIDLMNQGEAPRVAAVTRVRDAALLS